MRDSIKHERATWDKEKKGLMDQIASLKIKATALHMQKAPPPEWVLEKHQLNVQCTSLQSRVAIMESERTVSSNQHKAQVAKLEKKVELLRKKLLEVMEHAQTLEAKAQEDAKQAASGKKVFACNTELLYDGNDAPTETWLTQYSVLPLLHLVVRVLDPVLANPRECGASRRRTLRWRASLRLPSQ